MKLEFGKRAALVAGRGWMLFVYRVNGSVGYVQIGGIR